MTDPSQVRLAAASPGGMIRRATAADVEIIRNLYLEIGREHLWVLRMDWTADEYRQRMAQEHAVFWVAFHGGDPSGFAETWRHDDDSVQIMFLGVRTGLVGRGIGKRLLSVVLQETWQTKPKRIFVHTRTYDGEHALANYLKRGFQIANTKCFRLEIPPQFETRASGLVVTAKAAGVYPSVQRRTEAWLRDSIAGRVVGRLLRSEGKLSGVSRPGI